MKKTDRLLLPVITNALKAFPVVYIAGPRQSGKTTLVQQIARSEHPAHYITFDDSQMRSAAQRDPDAFLKGIEGPVVLDEIQLVPELFRPLKITVDENRKLKNGGRGQFLLTGSASVMALPTLSDALVGRMSIHTLLPFSVHEIQKEKSKNFIDRVFSTRWSYQKIVSKNVFDLMRSASFPELFTFDNEKLIYEWCNSYIETILQRDVRALMEIEKIAALPDMLRLLSSRTGGLLNETALSNDAQLNHITVKRYRTLLENLFLTLSIPAWSKNLGKRLVKSPKVYLNDINLLLFFLNRELSNIAKTNPHLLGKIIENFVAIELTKQITFSDVRAALYHYRTASGQEIDFVLEGPNQQIVGIEVKSKSKVDANDFRHLAVLQKELPEQFHAGFVLYMGDEIISFGRNLWAVPMTEL